jgi:hypothetical protein
MMPNSGSYLLSNVGFSKEEKPTLLLQEVDSFLVMHPIGKTYTLTFDLSQRFCTGWRDMTTGERYTCPDKQSVQPKYEQCPACQKRTGFNPAFYHATSVSPQQETRNLEPHILYLAHFGSGVIKVGISHAKRGYARLLEQGARTALILGELPTAHIARQYEAQIASLPGVVESIQLRKKMTLALTPYDLTQAEQELTRMQQRIEASIDRSFDAPVILSFDNRYFPAGIPDVTYALSMEKDHYLSGQGAGMLGSILFCRQGDTVIYLPLKKYVGYRFNLTHDQIEITAPAQQISLF